PSFVIVRQRSPRIQPAMSPVRGRSPKFATVRCRNCQVAVGGARLASSHSRAFSTSSIANPNGFQTVAKELSRPSPLLDRGRAIAINELATLVEDAREAE